MNRKAASLFTLLIVGATALVAAGSLPAEAAACVTIPGAAHRGGDERYAENSRNSFRVSPVPTWETDVRFTSDYVPVIMHDEDVDRTTDGAGPVADFTYAQLEQLRTVDDQPVASLRELVNDAAVDGARMFIELKTMPTTEQWGPLLSALSSRNIPQQLIITSFDGPTLVALHARAGQYPTGLIASTGDQTAASVTQYGTSILIKHKDSITAARMSAWTAGGLKVYAWTVDDAAEWARMAWYPALAGVLTDKPAAYVAWQKARTCQAVR